MSNLKIVYKIFKTSSSPEEVFGKDKEGIKKQYLYFAQTVHPDHNKDQEKLSNECFVLLKQWKEKADERVRLGLYGNVTFKTTPNPTFHSKIIRQYELGQKLFEGNLSQIFLGTGHDGQNVLLKVVNTHKDNDLLENEWNNLSVILKTKMKSCVHISKIINSFETKNKSGIIKRVNVFKLSPNRYYTFEDVAKKYPTGIPASASAWMFNRLLAGLFAAHSAGIVHGGIVPCNILINTEHHNGRIIDWCYSTKAGSKIKALVPQYKSFYPKEVFNKTSSFAVDISMAAKCIKWLLKDSSKTPRQINGFLDYCILERPQDVLKVYDEFKYILIDNFGPPKFIKFEM